MNRYPEHPRTWRRRGAALGVFLAALAAGAPPVRAQLDFGARKELSVGLNPRSLATGDLNGDGKRDIVTACGSSSTLSTLLNNGNGIFRPEATMSTGQAPHDVVLASINSNTDALLDAAVSVFLEDKIQVFLGNGAGGFGLPSNVPTGLGTQPFALAVLDWNLDGRKDLVASMYGTNEVRLYTGNGLGGFTLQQTIPVDLGPGSLAVGDWDGDGKADLAVVSVGDLTLDPPGPSSLLIKYGCPTGFCFGGTTVLPAVSESVSFGLLNNDAYPDLVVSGHGTGANSLSILYGDPDFGFTSVTPQAVGEASIATAIGDFNGDTKSDLAVGLELSGGQGKLKIFTGNGFGVFTAGGTFSIGSILSAISAVDVAGSTALDLITANVTAQSLSLLVGNGAAGFSTSPVYSFPVGTPVTALSSGDLNNDGKADLAVAQTDLNQGNILWGVGNGTFTTGPVLALPGTTNNPAIALAVSVRNFTSDNNLDVVFLDNGLDQISLFTGNGAGVFTGPANLNLGGTDVDASSFGVGPVNDTDTTHPDLVVANPLGDASFPYGSISVFLQNATGFSAATRYAGGSNPVCLGGFTPGAACASNADCLGRCDITTTQPCAGDIDCPSQETCTNPSPGNCNFGPTGVAVATMDADTNRDLVVCENTPNVASFLVGNGTGAYPAVTNSVATGLGPRTPVARDFDLDGDQDLVTVNNASATYSSFTGDNTGALTPVLQGPAGPGAWKGMAADFNLDGFDDLAVNNVTAGSIAILLGDGAGRFGRPVRFGAGGTPQDITSADYNNDGKPDLAVTNEEDGEVQVLLNLSQSPLLTATQGAGGTRLDWSPMPEAFAYDVIRALRSNVTQTATQVILGAVTCIENDSPDVATQGNEDNAVPALGNVYFYLFRHVDPQIKGSYGRSTLGKIRVPASGDCL